MLARTLFIRKFNTFVDVSKLVIFQNMTLIISLSINTACGKKNELAPGAQEIKCKTCSGRIFYKVRAREPIQYEAR